MANRQLAPPPFGSDEFSRLLDRSVGWKQWFVTTYQRVVAIAWSAIDFVGSNLTDIATRNHNDLQNMQKNTAPAEYYHVRTQDTGWTAFSGGVTANKAAYAPATSYTVSVAYSQAEVQAIAAALVDANSRLRAYEDALRYHGLIN